MNTTSTPRAGTTTAAAVVNFVVCGITLAGFLLIVIFIDWLGHLSSTSSGRHVATSFALLFLVAGAGIGVLLISAGVAVLRRRAWGRWTLVAVYSLGTLNASLGLMSSAGSGRPLAVSLLWAGAQAAVLLLLLVPSTSADAAAPALLRYWDGRAWTQHTAPRPTAGAPPLR